MIRRTIIHHEVPYASLALVDAASLTSTIASGLSSRGVYFSFEVNVLDSAVRDGLGQRTPSRHHSEHRC